MGQGDILSDRALNRATLQRQLLLERSSRPAVAAVAHLVGMQAQEPLDPYFGLWSRLAGFAPVDIAKPLLDRELVRTVVMRGTIHLVTADDCLTLRPLMQPVLDAEMRRHRDYAPRLEGLDLEPVLAFARRFLGEAPRSVKELRAALAESFPDHDPGALAFACRNRLALVQVPPRGVWGQRLQVTYATAESWLGRPLDARASLDEVVLRYLAAFGPASVADVAAWSRLTGQREVVDRIRPRLRSFRDEHGRELVDLPEAPRPDPDTPAPPRFLPEYDNALLSHADRRRFLDRAEATRLFAGVGNARHAPGGLLLDGRLRATWRLDHDPTAGTATVVIQHLGPLPSALRDAVETEAGGLLQFAAPEATSRDIRFVDLDSE